MVGERERGMERERWWVRAMERWWVRGREADGEGIAPLRGSVPGPCSFLASGLMKQKILFEAYRL